MKETQIKGLICFLRLLVLVIFPFTFQNGYAQASASGGTLNGNTLYYSTQSGESSSLKGTLTINKSDSIYEHGNAHLSVTGPIHIDPVNISMGTGQPMSKTFHGKVTVDVSSAPQAGDSARANITGTYTIYYSCPVDKPCKPDMASWTGAAWQCSATATTPCHAGHTAPGPHQMVEQTGQDSADVTVQSMKVTIAGAGALCDGAEGNYTAIPFPAGVGTLHWSVAGHSTIVGPSTGPTCTVKASFDLSIPHPTITLTCALHIVDPSDPSHIIRYKKDFIIDKSPHSDCK